MKWNNRLKSVLTKPAESVFSEDCLETELRITAETPESLVSAVIRSCVSRQSSEKTLSAVLVRTVFNRLFHFIFFLLVQ